MAFVDHDQIEEIWCDLFKRFLVFLRASYSLIEREVNFISGINGASADFGHCRTKWLEIIIFGLVDQNVAIGKEQNAFLFFDFHRRQMIWNAV